MNQKSRTENRQRWFLDREESSDAISETPNDIQEDDETKSHMEVHFIDVGQGDSTLVEVSENGEEYTILIDAGNFYNSDVMQYLQSQQVGEIDIAIGTHPRCGSYWSVRPGCKDL